MADTTIQRRFPAHQTSLPRRSRGGSASGGLMILMAILLFGSALIIPAGQAIQEASMRDRIAAMTTARESQSAPPTTSRAAIPALIEADESAPEFEPSSGLNDLPERRGFYPLVAELGDGDPVEGEYAEPRIRNPVPAHIQIPSVGIDTHIVSVTSLVTEVDGVRVREWEVASYAAGHHDTSARPGEGGNTVITGHNDWEGEVFRTLEFVELGDDVFIETSAGTFHYVIDEFHMRREVNVSFEERLTTGQFMSPMDEERITLITCWPYGINDHRVIIVARPVSDNYFAELREPEPTVSPRAYAP